jgi:8-oxo-dGTP pyrophosphatase MutT (NUDIX family)
MNDHLLNGVVAYEDNSRHTDYLFRVSLKAVVINDDGEVLIVKEAGRDWWDIPGGGLDHGESIKEALIRELHEEVGFSGDLTYEPIDVGEPHVLKNLNLYQMRLTFLVKPDNFDFQPGVDGDEVKFINPNDFKESEKWPEKSIYKYSQLAIKLLALI